MEVKSFVKVLIFVLNFQEFLAQTPAVDCSYAMLNNRYTCVLSIHNPNSFDNFTSVGGIHLSNKSNFDVEVITRSSLNNDFSKNFPSIICDTFRFARDINLLTIGVESISRNSFRNCRRIVSLTLSRNQIEKIEENSFDTNVNLEMLSLSGNRLETLPENLLINQYRLTHLWINGNNITDLPARIFDSLSSLLVLYFDSNRISYLRAEWFRNLESLDILYINNNQIEELPKNAFSNLKNMRDIYLNHNRLQIIHGNSFSELPKLEFVQFQNNQIEAIDETFINDTGVIEIMMTGNLCANRNILDPTQERINMRHFLQFCFKHFLDLMAKTTTVEPTTTSSTTKSDFPTQESTTAITPTPGGCPSGFLEERVCALEDDNIEVFKNIQELRFEDQRLYSMIEELRAKIGSLEMLKVDHSSTNSQELVIENQQLKNTVHELGYKVENLVNANHELKENLENQNKIFDEEMAKVQNQVFELNSRTCACN